MQERTVSAISVVDLITLAKRSCDNRHPCGWQHHL